MSSTDLDLLIVSDAGGGYRNVAFPFDFANLTVDGRVMTVQALLERFAPSAAPLLERMVSWEQTGKLNGVVLYDRCRAAGLRCALVETADPEEPAFVEAMERGPACIALSTTWLLSAEEVAGVAALVRAMAPRAVIVAGGPLVFNSALLLERHSDESYDTASAAKDYFFLDGPLKHHRDIDAFIIDELGHETLIQVVRAAVERRGLESIDNLVFVRRDKLKQTPRRPERARLADHLVRWDELPEELVPPVVPVQLSRGCPYRCRYCNFSGHRRREVLDAEAIGRQLRRLAARRSSIRHVRFVDDSMGRQTMRSLCEAIEATGLELPWSSMARADALERPLVEALARRGCHTLQLGLESGDDRMLAAMSKRATAEGYLDALALLDEVEINARLYFLLGFPGESAETVDATIEFIGKIPSTGRALVEYGVAPFFLLPLSPVYERAQRQRWALEGYMSRWRHCTMRSDEVMVQIKRVFHEVDGAALWGYPGDAITTPSSAIKELKRRREQLQRASASGAHAESLDRRWHALVEAARVAAGGE